MTPKDVQETIAAMRAVRKQYAKSPELARQFLFEAGFNNADGTLAAPHSDEKEDEGESRAPRDFPLTPQPASPTVRAQNSNREPHTMRTTILVLGAPSTERG